MERHISPEEETNLASNFGVRPDPTWFCRGGEWSEAKRIDRPPMRTGEGGGERPSTSECAAGGGSGLVSETSKLSPTWVVLWPEYNASIPGNTLSC